ncbi:dATP/dGTP pyrophosphohydrolase domain-containing protein, partial [Escherichia coli]|uniref:dATP/dGTP pyrophosphohydrolase domain-containing protein n=1 Tax=Escherichia coli TaxID=562 RepID=UPI00358F49A3
KRVFLVILFTSFSGSLVSRISGAVQKHLSKEALEAAAEPDDLSEWADMQFLLWDAQRRAGISDAEITVAMEDKLKINMERQWPEPKDGEPRLHIKEPGNSPVIPDGLSTVCAEAYQVVGVMADALGVFGDAAVQKVLDNLSQQKLVHRDVLPFSLPVTPDGWVMVPKQVTPEISNAINVVGQRCTCGNCSQRLWDLLLDATQQGVNRG